MNIIFVSGEEGMIAKELIKQLIKRGDAVINSSKLFDKFRTYDHYIKNKNFMFKDSKRKKEIDITKPGLIDIFKKIRVDMIIHCAAYVNTSKCDADLSGAIDCNIKGTYNLVNIAKQLDIKFVNFSTTATFDVTQYDGYEVIMNEDTPRLPVTYYGQTKFVAEQIVKWNLKNYLNFLPVFFYGLYPQDNSSELVKIIYNTIKKRPDYNVTLGLRNWKAYFYVEDAVDAIIKIIFNKRAWKEVNRDFVIGTKDICLYREYINTIKEELKVDRVNAIFLENKDYLQNHIADNSKMMRFAKGWKQKTFIKQGIQKIIRSING